MSGTSPINGSGSPVVDFGSSGPTNPTSSDHVDRPDLGHAGGEDVAAYYFSDADGAGGAGGSGGGAGGSNGSDGAHGSSGWDGVSYPSYESQVFAREVAVGGTAAIAGGVGLLGGPVVAGMAGVAAGAAAEAWYPPLVSREEYNAHHQGMGPTSSPDELDQEKLQQMIDVYSYSGTS